PISQGRAATFYFPVDWQWLCRRWIKRMDPQVIVIAETELWPGFLLASQSLGVPVALVNGRISDRSFRRYRRLSFFFAPLLMSLAALCVQTSRDKKRLLEMGAPSQKVHWTGNLKYDYDSAPDQEREALAGRVAQLLKGGGAAAAGEEDIDKTRAVDQPDRPAAPTSPPSSSAEGSGKPVQPGPGEARGRSAESGRRIWVCGSTREGEEDLLLDCLLEVRRDFEGLRMVLAPRHPHRCQEVEAQARRRGLSVLRRSRLQDADPAHPPDVLLVDTIGDLRYLYRCADVVFVGGSLMKGGGQNILEPAYFGKAVLFGPHMENFREMAASFTESYAALQVGGADELRQSLLHLLQDRTAAKWLGRNARKVMRTSQGAVERTLEILAPHLGDGKTSNRPLTGGPSPDSPAGEDSKGTSPGLGAKDQTPDAASSGGKSDRNSKAFSRHGSPQQAGDGNSPREDGSNPRGGEED
ncbi:MAG TPA: glycosyltransferase N-terminal domain-containing protein, partial [Acidobacteriota bacterium]|nr:glycosyltransferase N-terminal domain-containing protein [Acidobacteriota bacterium]